MQGRGNLFEGTTRLHIDISRYPELSGAVISTCKKYRYSLWRFWDRTKAIVFFMMLNPSTADARMDDPTIRRCIGYAKEWGYGGIFVGNLFAYRATNPQELYLATDPMGPENKHHLEYMYQESEIMILAYGNGKIVNHLITDTQHEFLKNKKLYCLDQSAIDGTPKHPLYLPKTLIPQPVDYAVLFGNKR